MSLFLTEWRNSSNNASFPPARFDILFAFSSLERGSNSDGFPLNHPKYPLKILFTDHLTVP